MLTGQRQSVRGHSHPPDSPPSRGTFHIFHGQRQLVRLVTTNPPNSPPHRGTTVPRQSVRRRTNSPHRRGTTPHPRSPYGSGDGHILLPSRAFKGNEMARPSMRGGWWTGSVSKPAERLCILPVSIHAWVVALGRGNRQDTTCLYRFSSQAIPVSPIDAPN